MITVPLYNQEGQIIGEQDLNPKIWNVKPKIGLVQEVLRIQMANGRQTLACTKGRGKVRGGGRKPWRQKGTGRARHGSIRSPLWRGGGVIFGPQKERNFKLKINKKTRRKAILMCLSDKLLNNNLVVIDALSLKGTKAKVFSSLLNLLPIQGRKTLIALAAEEKNISRISRNIPKVQTIAAPSLNVKDLLKYPVLLTTVKGVMEIEKTFHGQH